MKKDSDNFYVALSGINKGLVPKKDSDNFYILAGVTEGSGSFLLGKTVDNFIQSESI